MRVAVFLCGLALGQPVAAATLRPAGVLDAPVVRLSDLFDGVDADRVLGPAPAPGGRIVVESAQLAAIARQFGVAWRPAGAGERAVLERPGRALTRDEFLPVLRAALGAAGAGDDIEVELSGFVPPILALDTVTESQISQLEFDAASGRFAAQLRVRGEGVAVARLRVVGQAHAMQEVMVPARRLLAGEVLRAEDLRPVRMRAGVVRAGVVRAGQSGGFVATPAEATGLAARRVLGAGQPIALADLTPPALVMKGRAVRLSLSGPGLSLSAQGRALEDGAMGARIRVLNPGSRVVLEAVVTGPDAARVSPEGQPMPATPALLAGLR